LFLNLQRLKYEENDFSFKMTVIIFYVRKPNVSSVIFYELLTTITDLFIVDFGNLTKINVMYSILLLIFVVASADFR